MNYQEAVEQSPYNLAIRKGVKGINIIDPKGTTFIYQNNKWCKSFFNYDFTKFEDWSPLEDPQIYKNLGNNSSNLNWTEAVEQSSYKLAYRHNSRKNNITLIDSNGISYTNVNGTYIKARKTSRIKALKDWQPLTGKEVYNQFIQEPVKEKGIINQTKQFNDHIDNLINQVNKLSDMIIDESMSKYLDNIIINIEAIKELL